MITTNGLRITLNPFSITGTLTGIGLGEESITTQKINYMGLSLIGDQAKKKKLVPVGFKLYYILEKYFKPVDIVCVTRHSQTSNTPLWHQRARKYNFYLRGFKYLIIMQKATSHLSL